MSVTRRSVVDVIPSRYRYLMMYLQNTLAAGGKDSLTTTVRHVSSKALTLFKASYCQQE